MAAARPVVVLLLVLLFYSVAVVCFDQEAIKRWADEFGEHLWTLGKSITRESDLKRQYKAQVVSIHEKNPEVLLESIVENVNKMLQYKMKAVKCIQTAAEDFAESYEYDEGIYNFSYPSAKFSVIHTPKNDGGDLNSTYYEVIHRKNQDYFPDENVDEDGKCQYEFDAMYLDRDKHFYNIPVNTTYSAVHVPSNVCDRYREAYSAIQWSEQLDDIFIKNFQSDPGLSWQYFGHNTGVMRTYPALWWKEDPDLYDCRTRFWYIEAATCSKDIIILMDNSGSMTGMRYTIAKLTLHNLLDTLGNNDFINVFYINDTVHEAVTCYDKEMLVQATEENIQLFKDKVDELEPLGSTNFTYALAFSFDLLKQYRERRGCDGNSSETQCNQAIMLITDGLQKNLTEVFEAYNREDNNYIPVRVFTYLIGREVTNVREIQWLACLNRGYYSHIQYMDEVREETFKYINVISRPLVLQGEEHPVTWTHAFVDTTDPKVASWLWEVMDDPHHKKQAELHERNKEFYFSQHKEDQLYIKEDDPTDDEEPKVQRYRMMTSVSVPAFNRKANCNNETCVPQLLGVAGTDVPLDDIKKMLWSYKIGVNGYPFIISNNGYLIIHPDLRPVFRGHLKKNYNSVDLTEVELSEESKKERILSEDIVQLREAMVNYTHGSILNLTVKFHYDDMKRVGSERRDYYFAPLEETPFTLGMVLPQGYGYYSMKVDDKVTYYQRKKIPLTKHFTGTNWKIHPDWLYCKYHYTGLHKNLSTPEAELIHFLKKMSDPNWKWSEQYEDISFVDSSQCFPREIGSDDYYCDRELVQLLFTDAFITDALFKDPVATQQVKELAKSFNVTVRFVSTHSGLTRWQHLDIDEEDNRTHSEFGDFHSRAIEESWYKAAVLQYRIDPDAFVFSVPFQDEDRETYSGPDTLVTVSHAIFPRDGGMEATASVVGFQFSYSGMWSAFTSITAMNGMSYYYQQCDSEIVNCYVVDNNGYIVLSEDTSHIGQYLGQVEAPVVKTMDEMNIYSLLRIFDYQAVCLRIVSVGSAANTLLTPFYHILCMVQWIMETAVWFLLPRFTLGSHDDWYYYDEDYEDTVKPTTTTVITQTNGTKSARAQRLKGIVANRYKTMYEPCDQKIRLIMLEKEVYNNTDGYLFNTNCSKTFFTRHIPHTNLILLLVMENDMPETSGICDRIYNTDPKEATNNETKYPCQKIDTFNLPRRKLTGCFSYHPEVQLPLNTRVKLADVQMTTVVEGVVTNQ